MLVSRRLFGYYLFAWMLLLTVTPLAQGQWRAGIARVDITPTEPMWMSGYGGRDRPADGKRTTLWAKALAVEDAAGQRVVLVTMDLVGIDRGTSVRVCDALAERYGLQRSSIALSTTHTHCGPVVGDNLRPMYDLDAHAWALVDAYTARLEQQIVEAVGQALQTMVPAQLRWGVGRAHFAVNRRNNPAAEVPELRSADRLQGPVDHDVPTLVVDRADGGPLAIVCGYACHATTLSDYLWDGDWPGYAQTEIEARHPGVQAMVWAGCGADQNPLPRRTVELAQQYGRQIADAVDSVLQGRSQPIEGALATEYAEIPLPLAEIPSEEQLRQQLESTNGYEVRRARMLLEQLQRDGQLPPTYPYPVQTWRLGDGPMMVFLGGEVVVDYALRLKMELDAGRTWVAGYTNDVMAYIPSLRVLKEGGYEGGGAMVYYGLPSPWSDQVEQLVVDEVRRQVAALGGPAADESRALPARAYPDRTDLSVYLDDDGQLQPITEPEHWQRRRADILVGMQQAMGRLPAEMQRSPDEAAQPPAMVERARQDEPGYTRLEIRYEVEPDQHVSAHLYLPDGPRPAGGFPAMLALHPTSPLGKRVVAGEGPLPNRNYAAELAGRGYVVLAPDYPSFGDDKDYDFHTDRYLSGTMKGVVNHIRGVDLLAARDDVDASRIGVIGHSLGGHNAMFVAAFDRRIAAAVSSCGWTPFADYYGGKLAGWTSDRYMPRLREVYGLDPARVPFDFYEVAAAIAPRAFFSCSPLHDGNFDVAGVKKAEPKVRAVYRLLGAQDRLVIRYPDADHDFPTPVRQEAYALLDRILKPAPK